MASAGGLFTLATGNHQAQREIAVQVHRILSDVEIPPIIACADMHVGGTGSTLDAPKFTRAIEHARAEVLKYTQQAPIVCVAGDFACSANWVAHTTPESFGDFYDVFAHMARSHPLIASRGNHDTKLPGWSAIEKKLSPAMSFL